MVPVRASWSSVGEGAALAVAAPAGFAAPGSGVPVVTQAPARARREQARAARAAAREDMKASDPRDMDRRLCQSGARRCPADGLRGTGRRRRTPLAPSGAFQPLQSPPARMLAPTFGSLRMRLLLAILLAATAAAAHAQAPRPPDPRAGAEPRWNQVELQADASREVQNDTVYATLASEVTDADPARAASQVNRAVGEALKTAGAARNVKARSGGNTTFPMYDKGQKLVGWRSRAEIRLESQDFEAAATLIGKLQSELQLSSLSFGVSRDLRRKTEDELIRDAVAAFKARAEVATSALGGRSYRIQRVALNTFGMPVPVAAMRAPPAADAGFASAPPPMQAGTTPVQVQASGTIEVE
jgi:predicted secreted protein